MTIPCLTVTRVESLDGLSNEWSDLLDQSPNNTIFLTPEWQRTWWRFLGEGELHLVTVRAGRNLIGLVPLIRLGDRWEFAGGAEVADFLDVIAARGSSDEVAEAVVDYMTRRGGTVDFRNLGPQSIGSVGIHAEARRRGIPSDLEMEDVSPRVELPDSWETYLQSLSKKDRHELRRKLRRLLSTGDVQHRYVSNPTTRGADVDDFFRLHRLSGEDKAAFMTPRMETFFRALVDEFMPKNWVRLYFLEIDGIRVASAILFDYAGKFLLYNSGYDPEFAHLSVGVLLKAFCLRDAISEGRQVFDFLQGNEPYKYDLGAFDVPIMRLRLDLTNDSIRSNHHV